MLLTELCMRLRGSRDEQRARDPKITDLDRSAFFVGLFSFQSPNLKLSPRGGGSFTSEDVFWWVAGPHDPFCLSQNM